MERFNIAILVILMLFGTVGGNQPAWADGPYQGKVVDAETKEPIEGAVAVAVWMKRILRLADSTEVFAEAKEALTDKNGEFVIPGYQWTSIFFSFGVQPPRIYIFKSGYGFFPRYQVSPNPKQSNAALLEPFKTHAIVEMPMLKTREKRLEVFNGYWLPGIIPNDKVPNFIKLKYAEAEDLGFREEK